MKKFLAMILAAMMVVMTGAALAEWDPMADAEPVESVAAEAPAAPAVDVPAPEGFKLYQNEPYIVTDYGNIMVRDAEFVEVAQAMNAAEDSAKYTASNGNLFLKAQVVYHPMTEDQKFASAFSCNLVTDAEYQGRLMVESSYNNPMVDGCYHQTPDCSEGTKTTTGMFGFDYYLLSTAGMDLCMKVKTGNVNEARMYTYYLFDYLVEVPASMAESNTPIYLQMNVNDTLVYYQIR